MMLKMKINLEIEGPGHGYLSRVLVDLNQVLKENPHVSSKLDILLEGWMGSGDEGDTGDGEDNAAPCSGELPGTVGSEQMVSDSRDRSPDPEGSGGDVDHGDAVLQEKKVSEPQLFDSGGK